MKPFSQALHLCLQSLKEQCIWVPLGQAVVCDELITDQSETWKAKRSGPGIIRRSTIQAEVTGSTRPQEGTSLLCWKIRNSAHVACEPMWQVVREEAWTVRGSGGGGLHQTEGFGYYLKSDRKYWGWWGKLNTTPLQRAQTREMTKVRGKKRQLKCTHLLMPFTQSVGLWEVQIAWAPGITSGVTPLHHTCHYISKTKVSKRPSPLTLPQPPDLIQHLASPQKYCPSLRSVLRCGLGPPSPGRFHTSPVNHFWGQEYRERSLNS